MKPSEDELENIMNEIDLDGDGQIDLNEFIAIMDRKIQVKSKILQTRFIIKLYEIYRAYVFWQDSKLGRITKIGRERACGD